MAEDFELDDIRLDQLELELSQHSRLWKEASGELKEARRKLRKAKARRDVIKAEVRLEIARDPESFGLTKGTEKEVDAAQTIDKRVVKAVEAVDESEYEIDIFQIQVNAREERRRNLEDLVKLHGQDYFSKPRIGDPELRSKVDQKRARTAERGVNDALNRKRGRK